MGGKGFAERTGRGTGPGRIGAVASVFAVLGLLLVFGTASAAPTSAASVTQKYVAPYSGNESNTVIAQPTGCGNTMSFPVTPHFNMSSGIGHASLRSTSKPCAGQNSTNSVTALIGLTGNSFSAPSGGHYHFKSTWLVTFSTQLKVKPGTSTEFPFASFLVNGYSELSGSNGTTYFQDNNPFVTDSIFSGSYSHNYSSVRMTIWVNATLPKLAQTYWFTTWMEVTVNTYATPGAVSTLASVNMASGGNQVTLTSYSVTSP